MDKSHNLEVIMYRKKFGEQDGIVFFFDNISKRFEQKCWTADIFIGSPEEIDFFLIDESTAIDEYKKNIGRGKCGLKFLAWALAIIKNFCAYSFSQDSALYEAPIRDL